MRVNSPRRTLLILLVSGVILSATAQDVNPPDDLRVYLDADELYALIQQQPDNFYLVDTRTRDEYVAGHIPGAIQIDYREIADNLPTQDREALIVVYCLRGVRSNRAARTLRRLGFRNVLDWGSIQDWPLEVATGPDPF